MLLQTTSGATWAAQEPDLGRSIAVVLGKCGGWIDDARAALTPTPTADVEAGADAFWPEALGRGDNGAREACATVDCPEFSFERGCEVVTLFADPGAFC